jgi:1-deoxy-D-xylulose-5-phosphate reductoisomerase
VLNAANEVAVEAFLAGSIRFGDISQLVSDAMDELPARPVSSLAEVMAADREAREWARERVAERASAAR